MTAPFPAGGDPGDYIDYQAKAEPTAEATLAAIHAAMNEVINDPNETGYLRDRVRDLRDRYFKEPKS